MCISAIWSKSFTKLSMGSHRIIVSSCEQWILWSDTVCGCAGWSEYSLVACHFVGFATILQNCLLVTRQNDNHSPGPGRLVPSSHQRSELSNTILGTFSRGDKRVWKCIPVPNCPGGKATLINISVSKGVLICHRMIILAVPSHWPSPERSHAEALYSRTGKTSPLYVCCLFFYLLWTSVKIRLKWASAYRIVLLSSQ